MTQEIFLKTLIELFHQSANAYRRYLDGGKTFRFAQQLKLYNEKAFQLLKENTSSLPAHLQEDTAALLTHYKEWSMKWEKLEAEKEHLHNDVFVFANDITFPKQAAQNIEAAYRNISQQAVTPQKK